MSIDLIADSPGISEHDADGSLLASKFTVPAAPPFMVARPGLLDRVSDGVRGPVTLVTGLAGSGKTQLLASWARSRAVPWPIGWVTCENGDEPATTFWSYVLEGLRRAGVPAPEPAVPGAAASRAVLARLAAVIDQQPTPVVLILDGAAQLPGRDWAAGLEFLLAHAPGLRVVLAGRWDPPLPLYRYRLAGQLREVRGADLAFTAEETARLMELHGVPLAGPDLTALVEHTEGWAAGIRLCACAMQGSADVTRMVATISGDESTIAEYFIGEVLRTQPPAIRRFLLETSVLDTFSADLAATVTARPDAARLLAALTRENAFIQPVGDGTDLYRYHRLFAELLRAQLTWLEPDQVTVLHQRAAGWLSRNGRLADAVGHAVEAGDWGAAAALVIEDFAIGRLIVEGTAGRLGGLLAALPENLDLPEVVMVRAALAWGDARLDAARELFALAGNLLATRGGDCGEGMTLSSFVMQLLLLAGGPDPERVAELAPVATAFLAVAPIRKLARHPELRAVLLAAEGTASSAAGDVTGAVEVLTDAVAAVPPGDEALKVDCLRLLAVLEAHRGRLGRAENAARQAVDLAGQCGLPAGRRPIAAQVALAWVALERFDIEAADRHLRGAGAGTDPVAAAAYAVVRSRRLQVRGELRSALNVLTPVPGAPAWLRREIELGRARLLLGAGRLDDAAAVLADCPQPSPDVAVVQAALALARGESDRAHEVARTVADAAGVTAPVALDAWLLLAMLAASSDDETGAREALRRALRVAGPENVRRPIHQVWGTLRRVLRDDEKLAAVGGPQPGSAVAEPVLVEALSKRELDVLRGMAEMLPTEEIAASMYVSVNTVKTHVRSILRKLSASRRNEAVRRARALNLL
ncbi:LuxR family transcriptional regulator [Actinoplanes sp. SE50]|uniref:LuxR C-terminal-related transcriptional regulator n=1 Tax=unclassified Actinoplanes TaxID=2626549 RepID=UPI00023ECEB4|nr:MULTISPECIES: LuxR C-terminal-related transcriptional regulator [unclassified Actinoplanes]AEV84884.1 HTH-type transcriptional regulator malT [Actinoplanes sp. SE50/110]ATO83275.1 LuxR family transcriptional regulator [Actinoplanes sp. SE50]SLM00682.1 TPR repeat containing transcriptional regulator LuxR family [Actinoplanes sp. SE50/110]